MNVFIFLSLFSVLSLCVCVYSGARDSLKTLENTKQIPLILRNLFYVRSFVLKHYKSYVQSSPLIFIYTAAYVHSTELYTCKRLCGLHCLICLLFDFVDNIFDLSFLKERSQQVAKSKWKQLRLQGHSSSKVHLNVLMLT